MFYGENSPDLENRPIFQYYPFYDLRWGLTPSASVRSGNYKLIEFFGDRFSDDGQYHAGHRIELYNLKLDPGESHNLEATHPGVAAKLTGQLHQWMNQIDAELPVRNPHYDPNRAFEETKTKPAWIK